MAGLGVSSVGRVGVPGQARLLLLGDIGRDQGRQLHASDYVPGGIPAVMPTNIGDNVIDPVAIACIDKSDAERLEKYRLRIGDIVYSRRGDVEKRSIVRRENDGWLCGTGCLRARF